MYTVYKHTAPNGKVYIGITRRKLEERWEAGKGYKSNSLFYKAILKYGWANIKHEVIKSGLTKEEAEIAEIYYISLYNSTNPQKGYNLREGGSTASFSEQTREKQRASHIGKKLPEEQKKKISAAMKGRKVSRGNLGHKHSAETKKKMSEARIGITLSQETREKISRNKKGQNKGSKNIRAASVINLTTGEKFDCITDATKKYKICHSCISNACRGKTKTAGGFRWKYWTEGGLNNAS